MFTFTAISAAFTFLKSVVSVVTGYFTAKVDADATKYTSATQATAGIVEAGLAADVAFAKVQAGVIEHEQEWAVTRWMKPVVFYPCALHFAAILVDSTFKFGWGIPRVPEPYGDYEGYILLSVVLVHSGKDFVMSGIKAIWK